MGRWMYPTDERILEHLNEESWGSPGTMASHYEFERMDIDELYLKERCRQLHERALICPIVEGCDMFEITAEGLAYLRGDLDARYCRRYPI